MSKIVNILMERDGMTKQEATKEYKRVTSLVYSLLCESETSYEEVEDILACELGLEMDYIFDII